jgi:uncharacterized membrane protein
MTEFRNLMEWVGTVVDGIGVLLVVAGALLATVRYVFARQGPDVPTRSYRVYRQDLGRAILLGLEFLVAGDIIRTVVVAPTLQNVLVLGLIVIIRTFLSMALELELEGRWPWQRAEGLPAGVAPPAEPVRAAPGAVPT